jgi:membrane-bound metal-dependent hydrolase YbcI (DUF457 family)
MPSPLGHAIAGAAAGLLVAGPAALDSRLSMTSRRLAAFGALGALPDVDLLLGVHSGPTHSIGAAMILGAGVWLIARACSWREPLRLAIACMLAYGSHILLDWLANDTTVPIGIMALWPISREHFQSSVHLFMGISRYYTQGWPFVVQNTLAIGRELAILTPMLAMVVALHVRRSR